MIMALNLLVAGAVSCHRAEPASDLMPLELDALTELPTRTVADGTSLPGTYILTVSAHLDDAVNDLDYFTAHSFVHGGSSWKGSPTVYWPLSGSLDVLCLATEAEGPDLKAIARWSSPDATRAVLADIPDRSALGTELMYGAARLSRGSAAGCIEMNHSQALLRLRIASNAADLVRIDRIEVEDVYTGGVLTVRNDGVLSHEWSFRGHGRDELLLVPGSESVVLGGVPSVFDVLLPEQAARRLRISYRRRDYADDPWDSAPVRKTAVYAPLTDSWWSGSMYEYRMSFTLTEIIFSLDLKSWNSSSSTVSTLQ